MLDQGIYLAPSQFEAGFTSIAHDTSIIDQTLEAARTAMGSL
jgi:glutamate-1-semialdehyde 2,1-aminomutase